MNNAAAERFLVLTLVLLLVGYLAVEVTARFAFSRISRIQRRMDNEYRETLAIKPFEGGRPSVLLVGNSLLLEGVDLARTKRQLGQNFSVHRYAIEQTEYIDWYFGLRRLYREGAQPAYVVLVLNTSHITSNRIRGEYFGYFMLDPQDVLQVRKEAKLNLTSTSNLLIATESPWFGAKSEIRNWLLNKVDPSFRILVNNLRPVVARDTRPNAVAPIAGERLATLKQLCAEHGSRFIFVIPPAVLNRDAEAVKVSSAKRGVTTLVPVPVLENSNFRDGFHLNDVGAAIFTDRLDTDLLHILH